MAKQSIRLIVFLLLFSYPAQARFAEHAIGSKVKSEALESAKKQVKTYKKKLGNWWANKVNEYKKNEYVGNYFKTDEEIINENKVATKKKEIKILTQEMPKFKTSGVSEQQAKIKKEQLSFSAKNVLGVVSAGRAAAPGLKKYKSGVPKFSLYKKKKFKTKKGKRRIVKIKIKNIPLLDIGEEATISSNDFKIKSFLLFDPKYKKINAIKEKSFISQNLVNSWVNKKIKPVLKSKKIKRKDFDLGQIVSLKTINKALPVYNEKLVDLELPVLNLSKDHLKMLAAMIIYEKGKKCHVVSGLFHDLAGKKGYVEEANYFLGMCAHQMGFYSESTERLIRVIKQEKPEYARNAISLIVKNLPNQYHKKVARVLKAVKNKSLIADEAKDLVNYYFAKESYDTKSFDKAISYAGKVNSKSNVYPKALFVKAISDYSLGRSKSAAKTLRAARKSIKLLKSDDENLGSLISLNLARMEFRNKRFKEATEEFLKVDKKSSYWVDGLIEQAWAQLLMGDYAGSIGNMYSLHSPYFDAVFKPESYAVRTIGYLNICQYGDAYQTLNLLEKKYTKWVGSISKYQRKYKSSNRHYKTVVGYLKSGKSKNNVNGLPYQVIREIGRKKNFINLQDQINDGVEEIDQYKFIYGLIKNDKSKLKWRKKKAKQRLAKFKANLKKSKKIKKLAAKINYWQGLKRSETRLIRALTYHIKVYDQARKGFRRMQKVAKARIRRDNGKLRQVAGVELKRNLKSIKKTIKSVLTNNEFLRFEVFSGSGENIRFQLAGGKAGKVNRVPAHLKPKKTLNWSVIGEYWQDEIGSYRSRLKNNCPEQRGYFTNYKGSTQGEKK